jgi:hypothetical protein
MLILKEQKMEKKTKSDKNKFIKKYLEHKSCYEYIKALGRDRRGTGIYILYKGDEIYYIGLSKSSLRSRLRQHAKRDRHKGNWDNFSFYQIIQTKYIKDVESLLLRIYRPDGNKVAGKFKKRYNIE